MQTYLYKFRDGEQIYFSKGRIDRWCVYRCKPGSVARAPLDRDYFAELADFGRRYGAERIYSYFNAVYCQTDKVRRFSVFQLIAEQGKTLHDEDYLEYCKLMVTLYYAMIAEENREPEHCYPLKKRVKKIGVFQVLIEGMKPEDAAEFSIGVPAHNLRKLVNTFERREAELGL